MKYANRNVHKHPGTIWHEKAERGLVDSDDLLDELKRVREENTKLKSAIIKAWMASDLEHLRGVVEDYADQFEDRTEG